MRFINLSFKMLHSPHIKNRNLPTSFLYTLYIILHTASNFKRIQRSHQITVGAGR